MATTITKTIGSGRDYASINAWIAGAASTYPGGLVANDVIWKGVLYKEGLGTNNEWTVSVASNQYTLTCDATRYYLLEAASGQSFIDNANRLTNSLRYNNANGVSVSVSGSYVWLFDISSVSKVVVRGIQIKISGSQLNTSTGSILLDKCLVTSSTTIIGQFSFSAQNSVLHTSSASGTILNSGSIQNQFLINCSIIGSGAAYPFVFGSYSSGNVIKNCAIFGFSTAIANTPANISGASSTYNATDLASFGWTATGNIVSKTFANQFQSITGGSEDFRVKAGADLINAGTREQTYTSDLDIVGSARSLTTPTIGAWEFPSITYTYARPSSDVTTQWTPSTGTSHFALIDEVTYDDADYIYATAAGQTDEVKLAAMTAPKAGTSVDVQYRVTSISGGGKVTLSLVCNTTVIATDTIRSADGDYVLTVAPATWAAVTDWSDMRLRFVSSI